MYSLDINLMQGNRSMKSGAELKLDRAKKLLVELRRVISTRPPFIYVVDTDWKKRTRYIGSWQDEAASAEVALICGDVVHNLRASLDHAFWHRVSPFAITDKAKKNVGFPFCKTAADLPRRLRETHAADVSDIFCSAVAGLRPFRESGGDQLLCLIDDLDVPDKHKLLIPIGERKMIRGAALRKEIPDFPPNMFMGAISVGQFSRDFEWPLHSQAIGVATANGAKRLKVPIETLIAVPNSIDRPMLQVLAQLSFAAEAAVKVMLEAGV